MRRRAILTLAFSSLLASCAVPGQKEAGGLAWSLYESEGEGAKLAYGAPASDDVVLMLACEPHSGQVRVSRTGAGETIRLASAGERAQLRGENWADFPGGYVEAAAPADHPAFARFAATGQISLQHHGRASALPVRAGERARIRDF
ncbi:MAG TPA: hypothetical protein VIO94_11040, partial [Phenylobacterium sp.]